MKLKISHYVVGTQILLIIVGALMYYFFKDSSVLLTSSGESILEAIGIGMMVIGLILLIFLSTAI